MDKMKEISIVAQAICPEQHVSVIIDGEEFTVDSIYNNGNAETYVKNIKNEVVYWFSCNQERVIQNSARVVKTIYHWMDMNTGEIRTTTWDLVKYAVSEFLFCVRHGHPIIPRKWKYNKKGY